MFYHEILRQDPVKIVDVGAAGGVAGRWQKLGSAAKTILFEPDERTFAKLPHNVPGQILINKALYSSKTVKKFYICKKPEVSSLLPPNTKLLKQFPESSRFEVIATSTIPVEPLDDVLTTHQINSAEFLKLDTQGTEYDILQGGHHTLQNAIGLEVESEFVEMYQGQTLFPQLNSYILQQGFALMDLKRYYWQRNNRLTISSRNFKKGQLIFCDALYFKVPESLIAESSFNKTRLSHALCCYLAYEYLDFAMLLSELAMDVGILTASEFKDMYNYLKSYSFKRLLPNFRGKRLLKLPFNFITKHFSATGWYAGCDLQIGN